MSSAKRASSKRAAMSKRSKTIDLRPMEKGTMSVEDFFSKASDKNLGSASVSSEGSTRVPSSPAETVSPLPETPVCFPGHESFLGMGFITPQGQGTRSIKSPAKVQSSSMTPPAAQPSPSTTTQGSVSSWTDDIALQEKQVFKEAADDIQRENTAEEPKGLSDDELNKWRTLAEEGVGIRSAEGQRFARDNAGGRSDEYAALTSNKERQEFRRRWAKRVFDNIVRTQEQSQSYRKVDSTKGCYEPFAVIVQKEGNDRSALQAATNYIGACVRMGGAWVSFNEMTKRHEYLYLKKHHQEEMSQCWKLYQKRWSESEFQETKDIGPVKAKPKLQQDKVLPKLKGKKEGGSPVKQKEAFEHAQVLKKEFLSVTSKARMVLDNMQHCEEWQWARGGMQQTMLQQTLDDITQITKGDFARTFLTLDTKVVKAKYNHETLSAECLNFNGSMRAPVAGLEKLVKKALRMHQESTKDD